MSFITFIGKLASCVPISAMLLHTFYIHNTSHTESGSGFFPKIQIRVRIRKM